MKIKNTHKVCKDLRDSFIHKEKPSKQLNFLYNVLTQDIRNNSLDSAKERMRIYKADDERRQIELELIKRN